ncbi:MAG: sigma-70 family RNA polymerase sigma factor [Acidimicrobiales bacterium]
MSPPAEFEELVRAHNATLRRFCTRLAGPSDGDDLMQETLTRAMVRFETLRDHQRFLPWCCQIARNAHVRRVRSIRPTEPLEDAAAVGDLASEVVDDLVLRTELGGVLAALPERSRQVLTARAEGVPPTVLASEFGVSRTLIDTWFARSRAQARLLLRGASNDGLAGTLGLPLRWMLRRARRHPMIPVLVAGAGITTLLLIAPLAPVDRGEHVPRGRAGAQLSRRFTVRAADAHPRRSGAAPSDRGAKGTPPPSVAAAPHPLGLPRAQPRGRVAAAAEAQPIVVGPLLSGGQLVLGADPCRLVSHLRGTCPPAVAALRIHLA